MQSTTKREVTAQAAVRSLAAHLAQLSDQRKPRGLRYPLPPLLVLIVLAKVCGANNPQEIAQWVEHRAAWLTQALRLKWKRMPHHSTYRRVLHSALDLPQLEVQAGRYLAALGPAGAELLNMDGKSLRGTIPKRETQGLRLLAVQQAARNAVVAQTALGRAENEISAAKRLLKEADLQGKVLTGDAIFAQQELSRRVVERGGDYLWKVTENQAGLRAQLETLFRERGATVRD
jgi:hypothetical protein